MENCKDKRLSIPFCLCLVTILMFRFVFMLGYVPSKSMEPTISAGSVIIGYRLFSELQRGDIVIFVGDGNILVKRISGVPGDRVYICDEKKEISVNSSMCGNERIIDIPEGYYFMIGDNKNNSFDSRYWKDPLISEDYIISKCFLVMPVYISMNSNESLA